MPWVLLSDDYRRIFINDDAPIQLKNGEIAKFNCCDIVGHDEFEVYADNSWHTASLSAIPTKTIIEVSFESWLTPLEALNLTRHAIDTISHDDIHTLSAKLKIE